jgi:hypothetical protein
MEQFFSKKAAGRGTLPEEYNETFCYIGMFYLLQSIINGLMLFDKPSQV